MKKILLFLMICVACAAALTACSGSDPSNSGANGMEFNHAGDALNVKTTESLDSFDESKYVYVFRYSSGYYRIVAEMTPEVYAKLEGLNGLSDEDYQEKKKELVSDLKVKKVEDITGQFLGQDSISKLKGKTGQELFDEGFRVFAYYGDDNGSQVVMNLRAAQYLVTFDDPGHKIDDDVTDKKVKKLTVNNVVYYGLSYNCTDVE